MVDRAGVKVERPERSEDDGLDAGESRRRMKQQRGAEGTAAASPLAGVGWDGRQGAWRAGVQPYLGARTRSGDMMVDVDRGDAPQRVVGLAVAAPIEPVPAGAA
jgi:hypothetical protein